MEANSTRESKRSWSFWGGALIVLVAVAVIIGSSFGQAVYSLDVDQVVGRPELVGKTLTVHGELMSGSYRLKRGSLDEHLFILSSSGVGLTVSFQGSLPDQFLEGETLIAIGILRDLDYLEARRLSTRCPSRYEDQPPAVRSRSALGGRDSTSP